MPIPEGATAVHYEINLTYSAAETYISVPISADFTKTTPGSAATVTDAAVQAAAETIVAQLEAAYPEAYITAARTYDLAVPGDAWPTGAQPLDGA